MSSHNQVHKIIYRTLIHIVILLSLVTRAEEASVLTNATVIEHVDLDPDFDDA